MKGCGILRQWTCGAKRTLWGYRGRGWRSCHQRRPSAASNHAESCKGRLWLKRAFRRQTEFESPQPTDWISSSDSILFWRHPRVQARRQEDFSWDLSVKRYAGPPRRRGGAIGCPPSFVGLGTTGAGSHDEHRLPTAESVCVCAPISGSLSLQVFCVRSGRLVDTGATVLPRQSSPTQQLLGKRTSGSRAQRCAISLLRLD